MKSDVEMIITHDGKRWIARNDDIRATGDTLPELDANVADVLRAGGGFEKSPITVFMGFDFTTIPTWIRQYASHYFNRVISIDVDRDQGNGRQAVD